MTTQNPPSSQEKQKINESEYRFLSLLWESQPIASPALAALCQRRLGWKKSTTYTVIKRLTEKGAVENRETIVRALVSKEEVDRQERDALVEKQFGGSVPDFLAAFLKGRPLTREELARVRRILDMAGRDG